MTRGRTWVRFVRHDRYSDWYRARIHVVDKNLWQSTQKRGDTLPSDIADKSRAGFVLMPSAICMSLPLCELKGRTPELR